MRPDIINAPTLQKTIDGTLEGASSSLRYYKSSIRVGLRRALERHQSVRPARRRKGDPAWAQAKFALSLPLHRFHPEHLDEWDLTSILEKFETVGAIAKANNTVAARASAFLRGLAHGAREYRDIWIEAVEIIEAKEMADLRARRDEVVREPASVMVGSLAAARCETLREVTQLGRVAENCLASDSDSWKSFLDGKVDIWRFTDRGRVMAAVEATRDGVVTEILGPSNARVPLGSAGKAALLCQAAGLSLERPELGLLPEFAEPGLIDKRVVMLGKRVAVYSEWTAAVRIDVSTDGQGWRDARGVANDTLVLSFDPARACGEETLGARDPREAVDHFGRKRLRRIVGQIAMAQAAPSLVQHRLLALAS